MKLLALVRQGVRHELKCWQWQIMGPLVFAALFLLLAGWLGERIGPVRGVSYEHFMAAGAIAMAAIGMTASANAFALWNARNDGYIDDVLSAPLPPWERAVGYMTRGLFRGLVAGVALLVLARQPWVRLLHHPLTVERPLTFALVAFVELLLFASLGVVVGICLELESVNVFLQLGVESAAFVGGVFPVDDAPFPEWLARCNPMLYVINAARFGLLGEADIPAWQAVSVTVVLAGLAFGTNLWLFTTGKFLKP